MAKLAFHESGFFQVKTMPENRPDGLYTYDGTVIAVRASSIGTPSKLNPDIQRSYEGVFNIPIQGRGDRVMVEISNDTVHPCKFSTCEWIGNVTSRSGAK